MTIKISSASLYHTTAVSTKPASRNGTPAAANPAVTAQPGSSTKVDLSSVARDLTSPENDVNMERVQAIRQALADGTLNINPTRIAEGILQDAVDILN
ncbi:flagellar biosynthesis anti-sigma factor FlgM [Advenella sp. RU8]|uniref:flagellar biosynthesis anti-sigma factor FlgM n=1 Tax=Advenella sp. RU8 TaxID=3399575 RepID=UPI003AB0BA76